MRGNLALAIIVLLLCSGSPFTAKAATVEKKILIGFHQSTGEAEENLVREKKGKVRRHFKKLNILAVTLPETEIIKLKNDPRVAYIESDAVVQAVEPFIGAEYNVAWGVRQIGGEISHEEGFVGSTVKIALLDTGIDYLHPELTNNFQGGIDLVYNDNDPMDDSVNGHGTHLAGIIAAELNGTGVVGAAPQASLYAVKVLDGGGMGSLSDVIAGIDWAIDNGMEIINLSLGINEDFTSLRQACDRAYQEEGILLIAAAGNTSGNPATFPAAYDSVIAVNGTDENDNPGWFAANDQAIELAAPGVSIVSTTTDNGYSSLDGTSQAAAHVTGAAALLIGAGAVDTNADGRIADDIRLQLQTSAVDLGAPGHDNIYGFGRVDVAKALGVTETDPLPEAEEDVNTDPIPVPEDIVETEPAADPDDSVNTNPDSIPEDVVDTEPAPEPDDSVETDPIPEPDTPVIDIQHGKGHRKNNLVHFPLKDESDQLDNKKINLKGKKFSFFDKHGRDLKTGKNILLKNFDQQKMNLMVDTYEQAGA